MLLALVDYLGDGLLLSNAEPVGELIDEAHWKPEVTDDEDTYCYHYFFSRAWLEGDQARQLRIFN